MYLFLPDFHNRFPKNIKSFFNLVYFHILSIAKFGLIFLWMITSLANHKIGGKTSWSLLGPGVEVRPPLSQVE
jgi:hypothetical protein